MDKKKIVVYTGVVFLSIGTLYSFKMNRDVKFTEAKNIMVSESNVSKVSLVAHRGFSSEEVGNSKEAITESVNSDYISGIEFDVRLTEDGEPVLSHGDKFKNSDNDIRRISKSTLEELSNTKSKTINNHESFCNMLKDLFSITDMSCIRMQRMNSVGKKTGAFVTLDETMEIIDNQKRMYIELKFNNNYSELSSKVAIVLEKYPEADFIIQCNNYEALKKMQKDYPKYKYQIIINEKSDLVYLDDDFDGYAIKYTLINYEKIKEKIKQGKDISIWTINDLADFDNIINYMGNYSQSVNYITDYPDCLNYQYTR